MNQRKASSNIEARIFAQHVPVSHLVFLIPAAISMSVYVRTASTTIAGGDAGELVAEGCTLGTAHPPGYPLYTIIIYLVTSIGKMKYWSWRWQAFSSNYKMYFSPAHLVNLLSCVLGSISSGFISLVIFHLTNDNNYDNEEDKESTKNTSQNHKWKVLTFSRCLSAISASLMCSFSPLMWQYNTSAEVFALHNLFISLLVYISTLYGSCMKEDSAHTNIIATGAFICGLSLTNQHTSVLIVLPVIVWVFYKSSLLKKPKLLTITTIAFLTGLSVYIAIPVQAMRYPHAGSWGDVTTWSGFMHHLLRRDYGTLRLYSGDDAKCEGMIERTLSWAHDFAYTQSCHPGVIIFLLIGALSVSFDHHYLKYNLSHSINRFCTLSNKKKRRKGPGGKASEILVNEAGKLVLLSLLFYFVIFHSLSNLPLSNPLLYGIHQRFWMHPNILSFILVGIGMQQIIRFVACCLSTRFSMVLSMAGLCLSLSQCKRNYGVSDQSTNRFFFNYAMSIMETLPINSLLLINYDQQWTSIRYFQECENVRADIRSINLSMMTYPWWESKQDLYPDIEFPGTHYTKRNTLPWAKGGFSFSEFIDSNFDRFDTNVFIGGRLNYDDSEFYNKYEEIPHGLVRKLQLRRRGISFAVEEFRSESLKTWTIVSNFLSLNLPCEIKYPNSTWEWTIRREFFDHMISRSTYLLDIALKSKESKESENALAHQILPSIVEAAAWLELASSWDSFGHLKSSPSMKKNLGLAYMNIVRNKEPGEFPFVKDIFNVETNGSGYETHRRNWWTSSDKNWKSWATLRWKDEWGLFLSLESSRLESDYDQIKSIYEAVITKSRDASR